MSKISIYLFLSLFIHTVVLVAKDYSRYRLPYGHRESHKLLQGYNGPWGHEGHCAFAYDFQMEIGTPVHAARSGTVVHIEQRHMDSTRKAGEENVIVIRHRDDTYGRYYHLTHNGASVAVGDDVKENQVIGLSGDSGASAGPHLHFDVTKDCYNWGCQTIQMNFRDTKENPLKQGNSY